MSEWTIELSKEWDVLGPFPINAREQHFLSPAFPLELSAPYNHEPHRNWSSAYADGGQVGWSKFSTDEGHILVSFPNIRWSALRATEGWAALQHHNILHARLKTIPPSLKGTFPPRLAFSLTRAAFFTLIPSQYSSNRPFTPEWHIGNIYEIPHAPKQLVDLPFLSLTEPTTYDLFISGDYEVRLFGDPLNAGHVDPVLDIGFNARLELVTASSAVELDPSLDVTCDFVDGWAFGTAIGVGVRSITGWWDVLDVSTSQSVSLSLNLLYKQRLAPTQSRVIPLELNQKSKWPFHGDTIFLNIKLFNAVESRHFELISLLKIRHRRLWNTGKYEALRATYFLAGTPTQYLAIPPLKPNISPPVLALHGAGVDIEAGFWSASLPRQSFSWIVAPNGRTSWGFDWHGPSADDAWGSLAALTHLLTTKTAWLEWSIPDDAQVVVIGHSNGGQGAWYLASKYPDRVLAAIPVAAYIKAEQYIPLSMSRGYHFIDPSLRAILEASLTPDDNDLFLSNVADIRILAIHGGKDENVPTWHSRQLVDIATSWTQNANISFLELPGKPHWYPEIFMSSQVQDFLSSVLSSPTRPSTKRKKYTLSVATPCESGSLRGIKIEELVVPGRLGRLHVNEDESSIRLRTTNVRTFSILREHQIRSISIDDMDIPVLPRNSRVWLQLVDNSWKVLSEMPPIRPCGPLSQILRSPSPLLIIVPAEEKHSQSVGLRIAHAMLLYFRIDVDIITDIEALKENSKIFSRDLVIIGANNALGKWIVMRGQGIIIPSGAGFSVRGRKFRESSVGLMFLHPHPISPGRICIFLWSTDERGLERIARLILPMRTGVVLPEFILTGSESDMRGIGGLRGAGYWDNAWGWSDIMSWVD